MTAPAAAPAPTRLSGLPFMHPLLPVARRAALHDPLSPLPRCVAEHSLTARHRGNPDTSRPDPQRVSARTR